MHKIRLCSNVFVLIEYVCVHAFLEYIFSNKSVCLSLCDFGWGAFDPVVAVSC